MTTNQNNNNSMTMDNISQIAKSAFTTENLEAAGRFTKEKAMEIKKQAEDGDQSLRFLALIGGIACIIVGIFETTSHIMRLHLVGALIDICVVLLGVIVVILEGKDMLLSESLVQKIHKYALLLKFLWGRGMLYLFIGALQLYQIDLFNLICGGYMCAIGGLYIFVGYRTANKLKTMRKSLYSEDTLRVKFQNADIEGDGLNVQQFQSLCVDLGLDLTGKEIEAAFGYIQRMNDGITTEKLRYESFLAWWSSSDGEGQVDENEFIFV
jgi:hypothetical protein